VLVVLEPVDEEHGQLDLEQNLEAWNAWAASGPQGPMVIEPVPPRSLLAVLATLEPLDEDFAPISEPPLDPVDL
jgi:hypothetical protein